MTISHYHYDHYTPFELGKFLDSSPKGAEKLYNGKKLFIKHPTSNINKSQQKRAAAFLKIINPDCVSYADGKSFEIGNTDLKFSNALPHGVSGSKLGYVIALTIEHDGGKFIHAYDVQGPINEEVKEHILDENPDILILSGPPIYLQGFAVEREYIQTAKKNLIEIAKKIPKVIVDHHLLRDLSFF